ncbi:unnamed protein product [Allacma fusca]|uniref:Ig-like domain-containing protein n=1 Tax=Allacma fusca TaxID=39272 RepID=A0A8J2JHE5_9HEXA|nr:unnamed protein product [Allacma fusca]
MKVLIIKVFNGRTILEKRTVCGEIKGGRKILDKICTTKGHMEPVTEVVGGPELYIDRGSTINLTCTVKYSPEPPSYIIWNHNNAIISYNSPRGGVSVLTEKGETTTSYLLIQQAKPSDSGRYSCSPSNAAPHSIIVHVLQGELPAAMQTGGQMPQQIPLSFCLLVSVILTYVTS